MLPPAVVGYLRPLTGSRTDRGLVPKVVEALVPSSSWRWPCIGLLTDRSRHEGSRLGLKVSNSPTYRFPQTDHGSGVA